MIIYQLMSITAFKHMNCLSFFEIITEGIFEEGTRVRSDVVEYFFVNPKMKIVFA